VEQHVEGAMEQSVKKNLNTITESVREKVSSDVQTKVESINEQTAKAGRSWVFPFIIMTFIILALAGCFARFAQTTNRKLKFSLD
jgi:hypothetical protein